MHPVIEILRSSQGILSSVNAILPAWTKQDSDDKIYIEIPVLGIKTYAISEDDIQLAVEEALQCFCLASEELSHSLESQLESLGWEKKDSVLTLNPPNEVYASILNTADNFSMQLQIR